MKKMLKIAIVATALVISASFVGISTLSAESLTVVSWGGAYGKSQIEAYYKPFTKKTGIKINSEDYNGGMAQIKAQVESGKVVWDVVDVEYSDAVRGCDEGLLMELDLSKLSPAPDGTPAKDDFIKGTLHECAVATIVWTTIYAYDKTKFSGDVPKTMADFFDLKKFPGKRSMRKTAKPNLEFALMGDGVPADQVYEMLSTEAGISRAFKKLDTIKDHMVWWEAGAQPPQLLADGEVLMATAYNGRIFNAVATENKPFEIVWDGQVWDLDLYVIPKGVANVAASMQFITYATDTKRLADQASWISYGPARKSSAKMIGKHAISGVDMLPHMPTAPANFKNALQNSFEFWADHNDELTERFNNWLAN